MSEAYSTTSNAFTYEHKIFSNEHEYWNYKMAVALTPALVMDSSFLKIELNIIYIPMFPDSLGTCTLTHAF